MHGHIAGVRNCIGIPANVTEDSGDRDRPFWPTVTDLGVCVGAVKRHFCPHTFLCDGERLELASPRPLRCVPDTILRSLSPVPDQSTFRTLQAQTRMDAGKWVANAREAYSVGAD